jgi:hypothetical protein
MRLRNLSDIELPKTLWVELATALKLEGVLPGALVDDSGIYRFRSLCVRVRARGVVATTEVVETGNYSFGRINLLPCTHCTPGSLTDVYLHELVHAWLHHYREPLYFDERSCSLCDRFADAGYRALGGTCGRSGLCGSYRLPTKITAARMSAFQKLAGSLWRRQDSRLFSWHPGRL